LLKWALLFLGLGLAYWWFIAKKKNKNRAADNQIKQTEPTTAKPQQMVSCSHCDLHLPQNDALAQDGRYYRHTPILSKLPIKRYQVIS